MTGESLREGAFPDRCPHCRGSSHSFQPDVLGRGAGCLLGPCGGCFTHQGLCARDGSSSGQAGTTRSQLNNGPPRAPHARDAQPQPLGVLQPRIEELLSTSSTGAR